MANLINVLQEQGKMPEIVHLASVAHDPKRSVVERMVALVRVADIAGNASIEAAKRSLVPSEENAPREEYTFIKGAKVRVRR